MSDSAQLSAGEEMDKVPELPRSPTVPGAHIDAAAHNHHSEKHGAHSKPAPHRKDSHSNVDVDFFDPDGVHTLGRQLSRMSQAAPGSSRAASSNETAVDFDSFDLEKVLRSCIRKCVAFLLTAMLTRLC